jgi:hypothetical protein
VPFCSSVCLFICLCSLGAIIISQWAQWCPDYKMWNHSISIHSGRYQHQSLEQWLLVKVLTSIFLIIWPSCSILYGTFYAVNAFLCVKITYRYVYGWVNLHWTILIICKLQVYVFLLYFSHKEPADCYCVSETCSCHL